VVVFFFFFLLFFSGFSEVSSSSFSTSMVVELSAVSITSSSSSSSSSSFSCSSFCSFFFSSVSLFSSAVFPSLHRLSFLGIISSLGVSSSSSNIFLATQQRRSDLQRLGTSRIASQKQEILLATQTPGHVLSELLLESSSFSWSGSSVVVLLALVVALVVVGASVVVFFFFFLLFFSGFSEVSSSSFSFSSSSSSTTSSSFSFGRGGISSPRSSASSRPTFSLGGGLGLEELDFSTQHLMLEAGHETSVTTSSHIREAMAWIHFPGQPSAVAVLVTEPRKPERKDPKLDPLPGLGL